MKIQKYFVPLLTVLVVLWLWREMPKLALNLSKGEPFGVPGALWSFSLILLPVSCAGLWFRPLWGVLPATLSLLLVSIVEGKALLHDPHETIGIQILAIGFCLIAMAGKKNTKKENPKVDHISKGSNTSL